MKLNNLEILVSENFYISIRARFDLINRIKLKLGDRNRRATFNVFYVYLGSMLYFYRDDRFLGAFSVASEIFLDGMFTGWIIKLLTGKSYSQLSTEDYLPQVLSYCMKKKKRVFLLGSDLEGSRTAVNNLKMKYRGLRVEGESGYFTDNLFILNKINLFLPDLLIVGLGLGKQEKWIYDNSNMLNNKPVIVCVGNYINILGGKLNLPPKFYKKFKIRWLYRVFTEPRLIGRYIGGLVVVFILIMRSFFLKKES